ncbi:MAG: ribonuclease E/G, partial [Bacteroidales bacterium]|nr:ribonuclease E/G [Bacteroidales bacterium]
MNKELIVNFAPEEVVIALLEDKALVELHREKNNNRHAVGDVFLGRVRKVMPGLNAAFVDVDSDKEGFLHFLDLGPQFHSMQRFTEAGMKGDAAHLDISGEKLKEDLAKTEKI